MSFDTGFAISLNGKPVDQWVPSEDDLLRQEQVEESIAACMAEAGIEYVPNPIPRDLSHLDAYMARWDLPPDEFARLYGYGRTTLMAERQELRAKQSESPNVAIREALSDAAGDNYDRVLSGDRSEPSNVDGGCYGRAVDDVYSAVSQQNAQWDELSHDLSWLGEGIRHDERVLAAERDWRECMADLGHAGLHSVGDGQNLVANELEPIAFEGETMIPFDDIDKHALSEVQDLERAIATADHECRHRQYDDVFREVQYELEAEFVTEHRERLEGYRKWLAETRG